ncbi:MAG: TonB-dependent receptor [Acidobacteria bacterium]|nr:TonB-dependent receptor [Acidobacteriota bacterium]
MRFVAAALLCGAAFSQTFTARITGSIQDATRGAVSGARISARQTSTNASKTAVSGASGGYTIPLLLPGEYEVTVEAAGFQTQVRRDVRLGANQTATLDFSVEVAQAATSVDVTAEIPLLQSETSGVGATLERKLIEQYPLLQRDVMGLLRSLPNVVTASQVGDARGGRNVFDSNFSVGGGRTSTNEVLLDGAPNTIGDFNGVVIVPAQDSVEEFRVETSSYSAEFGRSGGGTVNIVTKAGTNQFHGGLYYYHQNDAFNANSFTNNRNRLSRPVVRRHQYGGTLGGPVRIPKLYDGKDRTFFFGSFEGRREKDPLQGLFSIPTAKELAGDFSETVAIVSGQPRLIQIFDPFTSRIVNNQRIRDPFPQNAVPQARHNPIARRVLQEFPQPNLPGDAFTGRRNFFFRDSQKYSRDLFGVRVDHYFSSKHRIFGRTNFQENLQDNPGRIVRFADTTSVWDHFKNFGLDDTFQISPSLNNVFRASYTRFRANQLPRATLGFDPTSIGLPSYIRDAANISYYPNFSFGFTDVGGRAYNNQPRDTQGVQEQILWVKARHNIRAGFEWRLYRFYPFQVFDAVGGYSFGSAFTQLDHLAAAQPTQGMGLASFLLGTGNFNFEHVEPLTAYHHYYGAFFQDDWRVTANLTLNLGLRWDTETGTAEAHNRLTYFDPDAANPIRNGPRGALVFTGNGNPRSIREANKRNFGPRAGFAYRLGSKMAVRGGYGIFYLPLGLEPGIVTTPFNYTLAADVVNSDYTPRTTLSNPFPNGLIAPVSARRTDDGSYRLGINTNAYLRDQPAGYMQEWNFGVSRQISRSMVIDATYSGSRGIHLPVPGIELNQISASHLAQGGAFLNERVPNPYLGQVSTGLLAQATIPRMQLLKPFPQFASPATANAYGGSLNYPRAPAGDSVYHSFTLKLERRFAAGLAVNAHYTASKLIDTGGVGNGAAFLDASAFRDIYNTRLERSISAWDIPQRLIINYSYELPFAKNKLWGGWTVFSVHTFESGRAVAVGGPDLSRLAGASPSRANVVAGQQPKIPIEQARANARNWSPVCNCTPPWFNTAAFAAAPEFTIPNGPRFVPNVRQDTTKNWDFSVTKKFRVREKLDFTLSGNFFNLLNQVWFAAPNGAVNSATFGSAAGVNSAPRRVELGAKFNF